ncbi:MAG: DNA polymerase Y family protein [Parvularculaceae bacterium]
MKRFLCVHLPDWPLTRLRRLRTASRAAEPAEAAAPRPAFALTESGPNGLAIAAANETARARGVSEGLRFADAKTRAPDLLSEEIDRAADAAALEALAAWMIRIAPIVALDGRDGLILETTGCERLYGGEAALLKRVDALLTRSRIPHRAAIAGTVGAACALVRHGERAILPCGEERTGLASLPVAALRLSDAAQTLLRRFGLTRIGQLYDIDRKALARRFRSAQTADAVVARLDQALGAHAEPLVPLVPKPDFAARLACPEPLIDADGVRAGLDILARRLCAELKRAGAGGRVFTLHAFRADGGKSAVDVATARPAASPGHLLRLFEERLDRLNPGFGFDLLLLHAGRTGPMQVGAPALSGELAGGDADMAGLAELADRLTAKLGRGAATLARFSDRQDPAAAERRAAFDGAFPDRPPAPPAQGPRPLRLLDPPEPVCVLALAPDGPPRRFVWRRVARRVTKADGPERLSPDWRASGPSAGAPAGTAAPAEKIDRKWLAPKLDPRADAADIVRIRRNLERPPAGPPDKSAPGPSPAPGPAPGRPVPRTRDYYRVEDAAGRRYWLFREGLYDETGADQHAPQWRLHGLFA